MKLSWHLAAGVIAVLAGVAAGQVRQLRYGRALDANYLIGSGGYNSVRQANRAIDGNLYVTGQVTGGFQFRADVGYVGPDQFRLDVPSAALGDFVRGSAGLDRILSGRMYGPSMYFSPERTVVGTSAIAGGFTLPGTSAPLPDYIPAQAARPLRDSTVEAYKPVAGSLGERLRINPLVGPLEPLSVPSSRDLLAELSVVRPTASALFGVVSRRDGQRLAEELGEQQAAEGQRQAGEPVEPIEPMGQTGFPQQPLLPGQEEPPAPQLPQTGQDVLLELLLEAQQMAAEEARRKAAERVKPKEPPADETEQAGGPEQPASLAEERSKQALEDARERLMLRELTARSRDMYNRNMSAAKKALADGRHYRAATHYELAIILNRTDPRAYVGRAAALFAADEPRSSAVQFRDAMKRFPVLKRTSLNLDGLLGKRLVDRQLTRLEKRIAEGREASLVYLAAFVWAGRGQTQEALAHARALKKLTRDEVYRAYADYLLSGLSQPPAPQPAGAKPATTQKGS